MDDVTIRPLGRPGDLGWVVQTHGEYYAAAHGFTTSFEALVARIVADFAAGHDPAREAGWIAEQHGRRVGCVLCVAADGADGETAQLRVLLVDPTARGHGLGTRLTAECIRFARAAGYRRMTLWTTHPLVAARAVYLAAGFELVGEAPYAGFGPDLIGQDYELDLTAQSAEASSVR